MNLKSAVFTSTAGAPGITIAFPPSEESEQETVAKVKPSAVAAHRLFVIGFI